MSLFYVSKGTSLSVIWTSSSSSLLTLDFLLEPWGPVNHNKEKKIVENEIACTRSYLSLIFDVHEVKISGWSYALYANF